MKGILTRMKNPPSYLPTHLPTYTTAPLMSSVSMPPACLPASLVMSHQSSYTYFATPVISASCSLVTPVKSVTLVMSVKLVISHQSYQGILCCIPTYHTCYANHTTPPQPYVYLAFHTVMPVTLFVLHVSCLPHQYCDFLVSIRRNAV